MLVCLSVHLYPINVKTAEMIGLVGPRVTQGRFMDDRIFKNFPLKNWIFENFENPRNFFLFTILNKEKRFTIEIEYGRKVPKKPSF